MRTRSTDRPIEHDVDEAAEIPRPSCLRGSARRNPETVLLAMGSNVGDREVHLRRAVRELSHDVRIVGISSIWETEPLGAGAGAGAFLNLVVAGWTRLDPSALLEAVGRVERLGGRRRRLRNEPRTIDVDILFIGGRSIRTADLVVPHPRFRERNFVLEPLRELARTVPLPVFAGELRKLIGKGSVRNAGSLY